MVLLKMAAICGRRNSTLYACSLLVIATIVGCALLVYISQLFGKGYFSESQNLKDYPRNPERLVDEKCISVCDSEQCVDQSRYLLNQLVDTVDPCENFYKFACGQHTDKYQSEGRRMKVFFELHQMMNRLLKVVLENSESDPESATGKAMIVYDSCMKHSSSDDEAIPTLLLYLTRFGIPNWPHIDADFKFAQESIIDLMSNLVTYREYGFIDISGKFVQLSREKAYSEINATVIQSVGAYQQRTNSTRKKYVEKILDYFKVSSEDISCIWEELEAINEAIEHLQQESVNREEIDHSTTTASDIVINCDESETELVCSLMKRFVSDADLGVVVSAKFVVVDGQSVYFLQNIIPILGNFSGRSIANYIAFNMLFNHLEELSFYFRLMNVIEPDMTESIRKIYDAPLGQFEHCMNWLIKNMYLSLGHAYMKMFFPASAVQEVYDSVEEFKRELAEALLNQSWIMEDLRTKLAQETANITHNINMMVALGNETIVDSLYHQFRATEASFLENVFEFQRFSKFDEMMGIKSKSEVSRIREVFLAQAPVGGGWDFYLSVGMLGPPFFRAGIQRIINLVTSGMIHIHEMGHSIHDAMEDAVRDNELDPATKEYYDSKIRCINDQFSQFKYEYIREKVTGSQYITENLPDMIAISIIDKIIQKYTSKEDDFLLPGFPYSLKQLLYISAAQIWCGSITEEDEELNYRKNRHGLDNFRILGMMQNSKLFSEAFSCPEGSYMNPVNKCIFLE